SRPATSPRGMPRRSRSSGRTARSGRTTARGRAAPDSPALEARPGLQPAVGYHGLVLRELRRRGAGVVGQDAQSGAHREAFGDGGVDAVDARDDAMLLVGAVDGVARDGRAVLRADLAVAVVAPLALRAAVAAHRHPP